MDNVVETAKAINAIVKGDDPTSIVSRDNHARIWLATLVIIQFVGLVGWILYRATKPEDSQLVLGAEISFVSMVLGYYFGSSSGSTLKSTILEAKKDA